MAPIAKILIISENLSVPYDRRVWNEANSLKRAGFEVSVICPKGKGFEKSFEVMNGIYIYRHPLPFEARRAVGYIIEYGCSLLWEFVLSIRVFIERGFDVIHVCNPPDLIFFVGMFYKLLFKKKFVFDHHDSNPELYIAKGFEKGFLYKLLLLLEKLTFKIADISIAPNQSYKKIAIARGGMREENVFIVRSGPMTKDFERFTNRVPDEIQKRRKKFMVGYAGVMAKQDGVEYLLRAAAYIVYKQQRDDILFVIIGDGIEWKELIKYSQELQLQEYVVFTGRKIFQEMKEYLSLCDVCINPDVCCEFNDICTPVKVLEYMALGKPVIQFDMCEGRYSADCASLYAKPNDEEDFARKIIDLLDDNVLRERMAVIGKKRMKDKLSWDFSEKELIKAYGYLLKN